VIDPTSRYAGIPTTEHRTASGRTVVHLRRRLLPPPDRLTPLARVVVTEGDRLDLIAARTLGDPLQWWRIADANQGLDPADLVATPGRVLWVSTPTG
jgi:nucleoid-associated protein YgaU